MGFEVNWVPLSVRIVMGMYVCFRNMSVRASTTVLAVTLRMGVANRYFVKTSIAVLMCVYPPAGVKGPTRSTWSMSPGNAVWLESL